MEKGPVCEKCRIAHILRELITEYRMYTTLVKDKPLDLLTDHARGFTRGQLTFVTDVIDDLQVLIPYLQTEADLRARSDKGI